MRDVCDCMIDCTAVSKRMLGVNGKEGGSEGESEGKRSGTWRSVRERVRERAEYASDSFHSVSHFVRCF